MLIGIDASRALRARRTGTENYSLQLIRHLLRLDSDHGFRLYCQQPPSPGLFAADGAAPDVRVIPLPRLWTHVRLSAEMLTAPPDVLFVPSHVLPVVRPRRSVVTIHDLGYHWFPEAHTPTSRRQLDISTRFNAAAATHVLADSQATKDDLCRVYGTSVDKVTVVHLGRDEGLQLVDDPARLHQVRLKLGIDRGGQTRPYLLYVGTLQPRKNLLRLIDGFVAVVDLVPDLVMVLAGQRGWLAEPIYRRVDELGLGGRVLFPGFVEDDDLPALLSGALAFVFPSLYEGFGIPVLEAQACGAPVLASNTSSLPEVAGEGALLVDPLSTAAIAAGLRRLLTEPELRDHLRTAGFANVRRFLWDRCARETLAVLERAGNA
ncbi:MAG: glycosyltransferase family 4 protein [Anaerolineae bacterium]|nr:glycosyltransferase family 4 protein [Anaerolineae bacterium]